MKNTGWMLLFLIAVAMFAPSAVRADCCDSGWVSNGIGYSPQDVHRFLRYQRHRQHRLEHRRRIENDVYNGDDNGTRVYHGHHHHHHAQHHNGGDYQGYRCVTDFWGHCTRVAHHRHAYRWRYYRRHHHTHYHNRSLERIDPGLQCHARRRVIGEERPTRAKAQRASDNAWMGSVRYDHGERYQDLNHAKDVRHNCDPSSTTTILKRVYFRCVVEATPCRAPLGSTSERVERRYEDETDDDDDDRPARKR